MFCNYCGKNFDSKEGFEEIKHGSHRHIRCEKCSHEQKMEEYDWASEVSARGRRNSR